MDNQIIIACDDKGNPTGKYISKKVGHTGKGKRHLAITVLLENNQGQVLLQKRKHQIFNDIWDLTGATHPLHLENGQDETFEEATLRCLKREYGINQNDVKNLRNLGAFKYFAQDGKNCENEYCVILIGEYNGELSLDSEVGYEFKWIDRTEFLKDIKKNPQNYSPWAVEGASFLHFI